MDRPEPAPDPRSTASQAVACADHMPFDGHRTQRDVREAMEQLDRAAGRMAAVFAGEPKDLAA